MYTRPVQRAMSVNASIQLALGKRFPRDHPKCFVLHEILQNQLNGMPGAILRVPRLRLGNHTIGASQMNNLFLKMYVLVNDLMSSEEGQDLVEYALLITLVALAAVTGIQGVASAINAVFSKISTTLQ
jgi:pilus assembly protein Flp/PilA